MPDALEQPGVKRGHFRMILNYKKIKKSSKPQASSSKLDTILVIGYYRI